MITRSPRSDALRAKSVVCSGVRCAERTCASLATPSESRVSTACRIVSQSDLLPITTATKADDFFAGITNFPGKLTASPTESKTKMSIFSIEDSGGILHREHGEIDRARRNDGRRQIFGRSLFAAPNRSRSDRY